MTDALRQLVLPLLTNVRPGGGGYTASCPAHSDRHASLSVGAGKTHPVVFKCHAGCNPDSIIAALGIDWSALTAPRSTASERPAIDDFIVCGWNGRTHDYRHRKVAEYRYHDADDRFVFAVARCALKGNGCQGFRQWRPDPTAKSGKRWSVTLPDGTRVGEGLPYRLPQLISSPASLNRYVVEGEKDVLALAERGIPATCNAGGAMKWTARHGAWLEGCDVVIVADRDEAGWAHAESVVNTLLPVARSIEVVRARVGKDLSDHLAAGLGLAELAVVATPRPAPEFGVLDGVAA